MVNELLIVEDDDRRATQKQHLGHCNVIWRAWY